MNNENEDGNIGIDFTEEEKLEDRKDLVAKRDDMADFFTILSDQLESLEGKIAENQEILRDLTEIKESALEIKDRLLNSTSTNYNLLSKIVKQIELLTCASTQYAQKHNYLVVQFTQLLNRDYDPRYLFKGRKYIHTVNYRQKDYWIKEKIYKRDFSIEFLVPAILSNFGKNGWEVIDSCKETDTWLFVMKQTYNFPRELLDYHRKFPMEIEKDDDEVNLLPDD